MCLVILRVEIYFRFQIYKNLIFVFQYEGVFNLTPGILEKVVRNVGEESEAESEQEKEQEIEREVEMELERDEREIDGPYVEADSDDDDDYDYDNDNDDLSVVSYYKITTWWDITVLRQPVP